MAFGKPLFSDGDLSDALRNSLSSLTDLVARRYQGPHETLTDEQIAVGIAEEAAFQPLSVDFQKPVSAVDAIRMQVQDFGQLIEVAGIRATHRFEFTGDPSLFFLKPNAWGNLLPRAQVQGSSITIAYDGTDSSDPDGVRRELERQRDLLKVYLSNQERQIAQHNSELVRHVRPLVDARRRTLEGIKRLREAL